MTSRVFFQRGGRAKLIWYFAASFASGVVSGAAIFYIFSRLLRYRNVVRARALAAAKKRRPVIGVTGSGTREELQLTEKLGAWCARSGFHILTGGGGGVMTSVSRAFAQVQEEDGESKGLVLAILPGLPAARACDWATAREEVTSKLLVDQSEGVLQYSICLDGGRDSDEAIVAPEGYPNDFVDIAIRTHLPSSGSAGHSILSRNHISILSADVVVALPGGAGTACEVALAVQYGVPVCLFLGKDGEIGSLAPELRFTRACQDFLAVQEFVLDSIARQRDTLPPPRRSSRLSSRTSLSALDYCED